jgi:membrane protein DedA with SNARE-associated domain
LELISQWTGIPLSTSASDLTDEGGLIGLVARIIDALGYPGIALLIALESIVPPIPSEAILPMAGFLAADGTFSLWGVLLSATIGSLIGALGLYLAGWWLGRSRLLTIVDRFGGKVGLSMHDLDRAEAWFKKHGRISVLIGRLVPIIRSLVSIPAGFARMPLKQFVAFTAIGSIVWNGLLIGLGYLLEDQWERVGPVVEVAQYAVIVVAIVIVARFIFKRRQAAA